MAKQRKGQLLQEGGQRSLSERVVSSNACLRREKSPCTPQEMVCSEKENSKNKGPGTQTKSGLFEEEEYQWQEGNKEDITVTDMV